MPDRLPPFVLESRHEVAESVGLDVDWTLCPEDWGKELARREQRNHMIRDQLLAGRNACYRSSGWSLYPRVWSNDQTTYEPVRSADEVQVDDIAWFSLATAFTAT